MELTFSLPHVFNAGASPAENALALRDSLRYLIALNVGYLRYHAARPLYRSGVVYGRTQVWDTIPALYKRGFGDCKSLTAALIAEYRMQGIDCEPEFRFKANAAGGNDYHILVRLATGCEDPSRKLGMGANENAYFRQR